MTGLLAGTGEALRGEALRGEELRCPDPADALFRAGEPLRAAAGLAPLPGFLPLDGLVGVSCTTKLEGEPNGSSFSDFLNEFAGDPPLNETGDAKPLAPLEPAGDAPTLPVLEGAGEASLLLTPLLSFVVLLPFPSSPSLIFLTLPSLPSPGFPRMAATSPPASSTFFTTRWSVRKPESMIS